MIKSGLTQKLIKDNDTKIFKREALAEPRSPHGIHSVSSRAGYNDKTTSNSGFLRTKKFQVLSRGHSTQKREADPLPRSPHGTHSVSSRAGYNDKTTLNSGYLRTKKFRGLSRGHSAQKREADSLSAI